MLICGSSKSPVPSFSLLEMYSIHPTATFVYPSISTIVCHSDPELAEGEESPYSPLSLSSAPARSRPHATNPPPNESHPQAGDFIPPGRSYECKSNLDRVWPGVAAGAAVALLYAPQPGVKTRRQLRRNFDDGVDYLEDAASCLKEQAESLSNEARKSFRRTRGQVADVVEKASEAVSGAVKGVQSMM